MNMTKRTRNIIFSILLIFFLIVAPLTVFYSLGWRFDWETKKIVQTGIFYLKAWPKSSEIYLDGELKDKTDIFFGSTLVDNLSPGEYEIEIRKEGYYNWKKTLTIKKREVTEAKNIILIPKDPIFNLLAEGVKDVFISPDNKKIIIKEENEEWSLKLYELKNKLKSHIVDEIDFSTKGAELFSVKFSPDSKRILLELGLKERIQYYVLDIERSPAVITKLDFLDSIEMAFFHPKDNEKLFIMQSVIEKKKTIRTLNEVDITDKEILPPIAKDIVTFLVDGDNIYHLDKLGSIIKLDLSGNNQEKLNIIAFPYKEETDYEIIASYSNIFLKENKALYLLNENSKSFKKISDSIENYNFSNDSKKLVYYNDNEINVLFLEKQYDQPSKEKHEELFITRFSEKINDVFWYTDHYLIFDIQSKIKVVELDDRDHINIIDLIDFDHERIFFGNKKLYILSQEKLYSSDELTP